MCSIRRFTCVIIIYAGVSLNLYCIKKNTYCDSFKERGLNKQRIITMLKKKKRAYIYIYIYIGYSTIFV